MRAERLEPRPGPIRTIVLVVLALVLAAPASASAAGVYIAVGDSVGAGFGASPGQGYVDRYCAYLKATAVVDQCVNLSQAGITTQRALDSGVIANAISDINQPTDTKVVTVELGGNDLLGAGCQPVTASSCNFATNYTTILAQLQAALANDPGGALIQTVEYYNVDLGNPFGSAAQAPTVASLLLGSDGQISSCPPQNIGQVGLNDQIDCISLAKGARPVDLYAPFANDCNKDCFSDSLHPNDKGYGLIFDALVNEIPTRATISGLMENKERFVPRRGRRGIVFSFQLDQPAQVTITIARRRRREQPVIVVELSRAALAGSSRIAFSGRVHGKALKPGHYEAIFVAFDQAGASSSQTLRFRILRRPRAVSRTDSGM